MESHTVNNNLKLLDHEDALEESLKKAQALTSVFNCAFLDDYDEDTLQWFSAAILDNVRVANDAWKALKNLRTQKTPN